MAIVKKFVGMADRSLFATGGKYFQMKERNAAGKEEKIKAKLDKMKQKKDWKIVEDCLVLYRNAMEKTGHLPPSERAKVLEATGERIDRAVVRTYTPRAEKQSFAHKELSEMSASLSMERKRLKK